MGALLAGAAPVASPQERVPHSEECGMETFISSTLASFACHLLRCYSSDSYRDTFGQGAIPKLHSCLVDLRHQVHVVSGASQLGRKRRPAARTRRLRGLLCNPLSWVLRARRR